MKTLSKKRRARVSPRALALARRQLEDAELEMNALYGDLHLHNKTIAEVRRELSKATGEDWRGK